MSNGLNLRLINDVRSLAQGDNASTVVLELLDEKKLPLENLEGQTALINFIKGAEILYQTTDVIFDNQVQFNVDAVIDAGVYNIEVRVEVDNFNYVFPSSMDYTLRINKSANDYYNVAINTDGVDRVISEVYQRLNSENPGFTEHVEKVNNPHRTTKAQVGLDNVDNVKQASEEDLTAHTGDGDIHVTAGQKSAWDNKLDQEDLDSWEDGLSFVSETQLSDHTDNSSSHFVDNEKEDMQDSISSKASSKDLKNHQDDKENPHGVTTEQINMLDYDFQDYPGIEQIPIGISVGRTNGVTFLMLKTNETTASCMTIVGAGRDLNYLSAMTYNPSTQSWREDSTILTNKDERFSDRVVHFLNRNPSNHDARLTSGFSRGNIIYLCLNVTTSNSTLRQLNISIPALYRHKFMERCHYVGEVVNGTESRFISLVLEREGSNGILKSDEVLQAGDTVRGMLTIPLMEEAD